MEADLNWLGGPEEEIGGRCRTKGADHCPLAYKCTFHAFQ
jgi:hypothetical protein